MANGLERLRVIVTAGASGIGRRIAERFAEVGARVAVCDIDAEAVADLRRAHPAIAAAACDVADSAAVTRWVGAAAEAMGGIDCVVNNAGIAGPTAPIAEVGDEALHACIATCLFSQFYVIRAAIAHLRASPEPSIVNISSVAGKVGFPMRTPYAAAKWGVIGLTKSLAAELGPERIRVNAVLPGIVAGDRQRRVLEAKAQRLGRSFAEVEALAFGYTSIPDYVTADDIAEQVLFLAGPAARRITGQALAVDGDTKMLV
jgi:NAD(P)-dependent dehydrogenase (short-subunit alcohol dehydrogenase family)